MSRNILVCTLGASWAVVPEIYGFLAPDRLPLYQNHPQRETLRHSRDAWKLVASDEIWVVTTCGDTVRKAAAQLLRWQRLLDRPPIVRIWLAEDTDELALPEECRHVRELLLRVCLRAHEKAAGGGQVVLSLAGGRKTMSADLQWAGQTLGCDALLHVIGKEPLPKDLKDVQPETMTRPLPKDLCPYLLPLVTGKGHRSEVLDLTADGCEPIRSDRFDVPECVPNGTQVWSKPTNGWLSDELRRREEESGQLLANYLDVLVREEHHENWRSLYRLPPRVINTLRETPISSELNDWLVGLPKADLHRHLGGCLDIAGQREVGRAVWDSLSRKERRASMKAARPLLERDRWPDDWPTILKHQTHRSHVTAALLVEADDVQLNYNLYGVTEPRVDLKNSRLGFSAYERPGELSGSALLSHPASIEPGYQSHITGQRVRNSIPHGRAGTELLGRTDHAEAGIPVRISTERREKQTNERR